MSNQNNPFGAILGDKPATQGTNTPPVNNDAFANANMTGFDPNQPSPFGGAPIANPQTNKTAPQETPFGSAPFARAMPPSLSDMPNIPPKPTDTPANTDVKAEEAKPFGNATVTQTMPPSLSDTSAIPPKPTEDAKPKEEAPVTSSVDTLTIEDKTASVDAPVETKADVKDDAKQEEKVEPKEDVKEADKPKEAPADKAKDEVKEEPKEVAKEEAKPKVESKPKKSTARSTRAKKSPLNDLLKLVETELTKHDDVKARLDGEFSKHGVETNVNYNGDMPVLESSVADYTLQYDVTDDAITLTINDGKDDVSATYDDLDALVRYMHYLVPHLTK